MDPGLRVKGVLRPPCTPRDEVGCKGCFVGKALGRAGDLQEAGPRGQQGQAQGCRNLPFWRTEKPTCVHEASVPIVNSERWKIASEPHAPSKGVTSDWHLQPWVAAVRRAWKGAGYGHEV